VRRRLQLLAFAVRNDIEYEKPVIVVTKFEKFFLRDSYKYATYNIGGYYILFMVTIYLALIDKLSADTIIWS